MRKPKEIPVKNIRPDGSLELMTPKESRAWRKKLKTKMAASPLAHSPEAKEPKS